MVEREQKITLGRRIRADSSRVFHEVLNTITEFPFLIRWLRAHDGELVRDGEVRARGKIVRYSGDTHVIVSDEGLMSSPNKEAGDVIRPLPPR